MDFSLSSSLVGSAVLSSDKLALDLQFATDKTLTARKGPTPVFTRGSTGRFVGSNGLIQSAIANTPRFDHEPLTGVCKGLLIEEQRTNLVLQSENFGTTWLTNNASISSNTIASPDGAITADLLSDTTTVSNHQVIQSVGSLTAGQPYTISVFAKSAAQTTFQITTSTAAFGPGVFANFILTGSGSVGNLRGGAARIESYSNGWYRCSIIISSVTGGTGGFVQIAAINNNSTLGRLPSFTGTNAQVVHLWGAQLELGAFPTAYIPTTTGTVIRSADVCSITGSDFVGFYNATQGSLFANSFTPANGQRTIVAIDDNTANEMIRLRTEGTDPFYRVTDGGIDVVALNGGTISANTAFRFSSAYAVNDFAATVNEGTMATSTSGALPIVDRMRIGAGQGGNTICGCIASVKYFKKRLPNAKLQALT